MNAWRRSVYPKLETRNQKLLPVVLPRQSGGHVSRNVLLSQLGCRFFSTRFRPEQPVERGARARQRCIHRPCSLKHTLHVSQCGILRKDDLLEVVLDPGTDKVEKRGLGPAPANCRDTG